ncbi:TPA: hypothetical protein ACH3X2_006982 [Trebouxia sp. C0005]
MGREWQALKAKVQPKEQWPEMYGKLEKIMYAKTWEKAGQLVIAFVQRYQESQPAAVKYFQDNWFCQEWICQWGMVNQRPGALVDTLVGIPGDADAMQASLLNYYLKRIKEAEYGKYLPRLRSFERLNGPAFEKLKADWSKDPNILILRLTVLLVACKRTLCIKELTQRGPVHSPIGFCGPHGRTQRFQGLERLPVRTGESAYASQTADPFPELRALLLFRPCQASI